MHEFSVAEDILAIIEEAVGSKKEITSVHMTIGPLSGICPDSLRFCFTEIAKQEGFGSPELVLNEVKAKVHCYGCESDYEATEFIEGCPDCGSLNRRILSGDEFTVDWVEVEDDKDAD